MPVAGTEVAEADGLLWGKVHHDESVDTSLLAVLEHTLLSVLEDWVEVTHQHQGGLKATAAGIADELQDGSESDTVLEGLSVGGLNGGTISNRVSEGNSELNDICRPS